MIRSLLVKAIDLHAQSSLFARLARKGTDVLLTLSIKRDLLLLPLLWSTWLCLACHSALAKDEMVIQQSGSWSGDQTILLHPNIGIKVSAKKTGLCLISKAPHWDAILVNTKNRSWCSIAPKALKGPISDSAFFILTGQNLSKSKWVLSSEKGQVSGIPVNIYHSFLMDQNTGKANLKATIFTLKQAVPANVANSVCRFLAFPTLLEEIPLKVVFPKSPNAAESASTVLSTKSITHSTLAATDFDIPKGFKKVADEQSVVHDAAGQEAMEEMVKSMGGSRY